ncbi:unnamed protein product [Boreogadus saida]
MVTWVEDLIERLTEGAASSRVEMNPGFHIIEGDQTLIIINKHPHLLELSSQRETDLRVISKYQPILGVEKSPVTRLRDTHGSNIANWPYRDPRTLSPLSSPAKNYSASNIEDSESQIPEVQVDDDEHLQSGGAAMETDEDLKALQPGYNWLQEYAIYLAGLNLSFLHIGEDSEMEVDPVWGSPASPQIRLNPAALAVLRYTTGICVVAIITHQKEADCWGCLCDCPSQRRHSCMHGATHHHYETHYDSIWVILDRVPFLLLLETVLKKTTGLTVSPGKIYGVVDAFLCDLLRNTYDTENREFITNEGVSDDHLQMIYAATQLWRTTLTYGKPKPGVKSRSV